MEEKRPPAKRGGAKKLQKPKKTIKNHLFLIGEAPSNDEEIATFLGREKRQRLGATIHRDEVFSSLFPPLVADLYSNQLSCAVCWIDLSPRNIPAAPSFSAVFPRLNGCLLMRRSVDDTHHVGCYLDEALNQPGWEPKEISLKITENISPVTVTLNPLLSSVDATKATVMIVKATLPLSSLNCDHLQFSQSFYCDSKAASFATMVGRLYRDSTLLLVDLDGGLAVLCPLRTNSSMIIKCRPFTSSPHENEIETRSQWLSGNDRHFQRPSFR